MDEINKHKSYHFTPLRLCHHKRNGVSEKNTVMWKKEDVKSKETVRAYDFV